IMGLETGCQRCARSDRNSPATVPSEMWPTRRAIWSDKPSVAVLIFFDRLSKGGPAKRRRDEHGANPCPPFTRTMEFAMQYVLAIYESAEAFDARSGEDKSTYFGAWQAYADALRH